ncbi:hypothetical protein RhiJN_14911 [Ceratobasidium sp. AG-Ba]|nr:hypothetical protein RhiJN_14911 [Ceratobasidium sp. AG-Ba]QRW15451.1 hypothetical protein RhiLY_14450 [Ceratobasidium sp. AG-Ba]
MPNYASKCSTSDNNTLVLKEISHRRAIASCITSLALSVGATIGSAGATVPLTLPESAYHAYKVKSHKNKLDIIQKELAKRHLSPAQMRKRDILVPVAFTYAVSVISLGVADLVDIMPFGIEHFMESQAASAAGLDPGSAVLGNVGNSIKVWSLEEAIKTFADPHMRANPPPVPALKTGEKGCIAEGGQMQVEPGC